MSQPSDPVDAAAVQQLAASLREGAGDLSLYAGLLLDLLAGALPAELVDVQRERRVWRRAEAPVVAVTVSLGDWRFLLHRSAVGAAADSEVQHVVRGIVLSSEPVPLVPWSERLAVTLAEHVAAQGDGSAAVERLLAPRDGA